MAAPLQWQQQQPSQTSFNQPRVQHATADEARWGPQQAQHVQQHQPHQPNSNSLLEDNSGEDVGIGRGFRPTGGAGVAAAMASDTAGTSPPPQVVQNPCPPSPRDYTTPFPFATESPPLCYLLLGKQQLPEVYPGLLLGPSWLLSSQTMLSANSEGRTKHIVSTDSLA